MHWVEVTELGEHWVEARVDAKIEDGGSVFLETENVRALRLGAAWRDGRLWKEGTVVEIDGWKLRLEEDMEEIALQRAAGDWDFSRRETGELRKSPRLQGPIDDAFLSPFLVVLPSGKSRHKAVRRWVDFEVAHFQKRWRELFRGELRMKKDVDVTAEDRQEFNLILWGDPDSNALIKEFFSDRDGRFPKWAGKDLRIAGKSYGAKNHVLSMIFPAGQGSRRYVVLNSGPTFREAHDRTNSLQNPKLPDWAVINLDVLPDGEAPGEIVAADFFDEGWRLRRR
jgi:hypothetical protein